MQDPHDRKLDRRSFLNTAAGVVAGSAFACSALSYDPRSEQIKDSAPTE
jgi:hypothetical protein